MINIMKPNAPQRRLDLKQFLWMLLVTGLIGGIWHTLFEEPRSPIADEFIYLSHAYHLSEHAIFAGRQFNQDRSAEERAHLLATPLPPNRFFLPLYPAFLAAIMEFDSEFKGTVRCMMLNRYSAFTRNCALNYGMAIVVQTAALSTVLVLVWLSAWALSRSLVVAWGSWLIAALSTQYFQYSGHFLTEILALPLIAAHGWALINAVQSQRPKWFVLAGVLLGLSALTRPTFDIAFIALCCAMVLVVVFLRTIPTRRGLGLTMLFVVGFCIAVGGWSARNVGHFGSPKLMSNEYGAYALQQRVAYNMMSAGEVATSFLYWLPHLGPRLALMLLDPADYERLDFESKNTLYFGKDYYDISRELVGINDPLRYLINEKILDELGQHLLVTLAFTWRGMWISSVWGMAAWALTIPMLVIGMRVGRWDLILFAFIPIFLLGLNASVSLNLHRYNLSLIPVLSVGASWALTIMFERIAPYRHRR